MESDAIRIVWLSNSIFSKSDNTGSDSVIIDRRNMRQAKKAHVVHASLIVEVIASCCFIR
jgi:hypothetical protein